MRGPDGAGAYRNRTAAFIPSNKGTGSSERRNRSAGGPVDRWRLDVLHRDKYTCQQCGDSRGGNLIAHHIVRWVDDESLRFDIENGITLCVSCHKDRHRGRLTCVICGAKHVAHGLCNKHMQRKCKYGDPLLRKVRQRGTFVLMRDIE